MSRDAAGSNRFITIDRSPVITVCGWYARRALIDWVARRPSIGVGRIGELVALLGKLPHGWRDGLVAIALGDGD